MLNLQSYLHARYPPGLARGLEDGIMKKSNKMLRAALQRRDAMQQEGQKIKDAIDLQRKQKHDEHGSQGSDSEGSEELDLSAFARGDLSLEKNLKIKADIWISYTHKVFKKIMYTRVVEVIGNKRNRKVVVENGESIAMSDQVRVMRKQEDGSCNKEEGFSYKALSEYKFKKGKSKTLLTLDDSAAAFAALKSNRIEAGGGGDEQLLMVESQDQKTRGPRKGYPGSDRGTQGSQKDRQSKQGSLKRPLPDPDDNTNSARKAYRVPKAASKDTLNNSEEEAREEDSDSDDDPFV